MHIVNGVLNQFKKFNGQFAISILDIKKKKNYFS